MSIFLMYFSFLKKFDIKLNDLDTMEKYCGSILKNILDDELWKHGLEKSTVFQVSKMLL